MLPGVQLLQFKLDAGITHNHYIIEWTDSERHAPQQQLKEYYLPHRKSALHSLPNYMMGTLPSQ